MNGADRRGVRRVVAEGERGAVDRLVRAVPGDGDREAHRPRRGGIRDGVGDVAVAKVRGVGALRRQEDRAQSEEDGEKVLQLRHESSGKAARGKGSKIGITERRDLPRSPPGARSAQGPQGRRFVVGLQDPLGPSMRRRVEPVVGVLANPGAGFRLDANQARPKPWRACASRSRTTSRSQAPPKKRSSTAPRPSTRSRAPSSALGTRSSGSR